ncbi:hypothetical protein BJ944DRAFT_168987 [Cunninghamella echinulata]|nr:hypothetical protein BJ944DRAFT_168987 [Cunninghamella echinulata]
MSEQQIMETLLQYQSIGNVKGAVNLVRKAQDSNKATHRMYQTLLQSLLDAPLDIDTSAFVAAWFYSPQNTLPKDIKEDMTIWHNVLKLGFRLGSTYRKEDLRVLIETFVNTFDLNTMVDQTSWELLIRGYGILKKQDMITMHFTRILNEPQYSHFQRASLEFQTALAYVTSGAHNEVTALVESLKNNGRLTANRLQLIIRTYGFEGDLKRTQHYIDLCKKMYPSVNHDTVQLIVHKTALHKQYQKLINTRGVQGLPLKPTSSAYLDTLHTSWENILENQGGNIKDTMQCNLILEYLTTANRIDPERFPLERAEKLINEYMPSNNIKPNQMTWTVLLKGYSSSSEYNNDQQRHNVRLDKALQLLARMQGEGFHADQSCFHSLYKACLPSIPGKGYLFDYFYLASQLTSTLRYKPILDHRIFELEKIMLDAKIPHDRTTIKTLLTCFGVTGKYKAMWNRWNLLKISGVQRDMGLYQHIFTLASMDPEQSQYALSVTRSELGREANHDRIPWNTYVAMLDCAITAQMPDMATLIIQQMKKQFWTPQHDITTNNYLPLFRAYATIPSLSSEVRGLLQEITEKRIPFNDTMWQYLMSHHILHDDTETSKQNIQRTFNNFTMQRFEHQGKIPIPVRETSPIVPFPSGPYTASDMSIINMYMASLLDAQDVSLVFDVLKVLNDETDKIGLSRETIKGIINLAKQEKSNTELSWLVHHVLPKVPHKNYEFKQWINHLQQTIPK